MVKKIILMFLFIDGNSDWISLWPTHLKPNDDP